LSVRRQPSREFQDAFDAAFSWPVVESERGQDLRVDLECVTDALAGPMYSVLTDGQHDYVYRDKEGRFPGVVDAESFRAWALGIAARYKEIVDAFEPVTAEEHRDRGIFNEKARRMREVIDSAAREVIRAKAERSRR
jgi:hypothetical protein